MYSFLIVFYKIIPQKYGYQLMIIFTNSYTSKKKTKLLKLQIYSTISPSAAAQSAKGHRRCAIVQFQYHYESQSQSQSQ